MDHERNRQTDRQTVTDRQTGLLWHRAMHYSTSRGKNSTTVNLNKKILQCSFKILATLFCQTRPVLPVNLTSLRCCADVDECAVHNGWCTEHSTCKNTPGSYDCVCDDGYKARGSKCIGQLIFLFSV